MITISQAPKHRWKPDEDLVALYLSRHGCRFLPMTQAGIAQILGVKEGSFGMRQDNFAYLDGRRGLENAAEQSREIHRRYGQLKEPELRALILQVLEERNAQS